MEIEIFATKNNFSLLSSKMAAEAHHGGGRKLNNLPKGKPTRNQIHTSVLIQTISKTLHCNICNTASTLRNVDSTMVEENKIVSSVTFSTDFQIYFPPIMVYCAIKGCKNDSKKTKNSSCGKISYFRFPKNQLWKEWVKFCGNPKINLATARVCSVHFPEGAYREKTWVQQQYPELMRSCTKLTSQGIIEIDCNENSIVSLGEANITSQLTSLEIQYSIPAGSSQ
ncbi:uncharacterized protein LOC143907135 isoform X2 [Temnothorax americanus]|uniref:uncharacterized protein LOC143907135 isoform X2 n=1 Tax=Temnothorax americanus TaxID=1964332 RepID=UPI0040676108